MHEIASIINNVIKISTKRNNTLSRQKQHMLHCTGIIICSELPQITAVNTSHSLTKEENQILIISSRRNVALKLND